eukprot:6207387-Pleurochrysis_carterae.AAC.4
MQQHTADVNIVFVCRGASEAPVLTALRTMRGILAWSQASARIQFHLLASEPDVAERVVGNLLSRSRIINASDTSLMDVFGPHGKKWLKLGLDGFWQGRKAHMFVVLKYFLHEILPDVDTAMVLDTDLLVLDDVCKVWDTFIRGLHANPRLTFSFASEQQNEFRNPRFYTLLVQQNAPPVEQRPAFYNGGVAMMSLARMRNSNAPYQLWLEGAYSHLQHVWTGLGEIRSKADRNLLELYFKLSDQTMLALLAAQRPKAWQHFLQEMPCEWNWQLSLYFYTKSYNIGRNETLFNEIDATCSRPPAILHFNEAVSEWCLPSVRATLNVQPDIRKSYRRGGFLYSESSPGATLLYSRGSFRARRYPHMHAGRWKLALARAQLERRDRRAFRLNLKLLRWALAPPLTSTLDRMKTTPADGRGNSLINDSPFAHCQAARLRIPSAMSRSCNASFLLQRHSRTLE